MSGLQLRALRAPRRLGCMYKGHARQDNGPAMARSGTHLVHDFLTFPSLSIHPCATAGPKGVGPSSKWLFLRAVVCALSVRIAAGRTEAGSNP